MTEKESAQPSESESIPHDRLFKEFLYCFLKEFTTLFFPEEAARLDFDHIHFGSQEQIINLPDQALRITDVMAEVALKESEAAALKTSHTDSRLKRKKSNIQKRKDANREHVQESDGEKGDEKDTEIIIVHVDVESNRPTTIPHRMFAYYSLLRLIKNRPVLPIALLTKGGSDTEESGTIGLQTYTEHLWDKELVKFRYYQVELRELKSEDYLALNDPIAACLAVLMQHPENESASLKKRCYDIIRESNLSDGDKVFLAHIVNTYLSQEKLKGGTKEIMEQLVEYEEDWLEMTMNRGRILGYQDLLIKLLKTKFEELSTKLVERIRTIEDRSMLDDLTTQVLFIQSVDELNLPEVA